MDVFRSHNGLFPLATLITAAPTVLTSLVYTGESKDAAVVVWSANIEVISGMSNLNVALGVRQVRGVNNRANITFNLRNGLEGEVYPVGGSLIVDVLPGDQFELFGGVSLLGFLSLAVDGFVVRVL